MAVETSRTHHRPAFVAHNKTSSTRCELVILRFPAFSGNHGWQWWREVYLNDSSVWSYDRDANQWENQRPLPTPHPHPLRYASWDSDNEVVVLFGGEGSNEGTLVYDPYENSWVRMKPPHQPEPRSGGNMVYDAAHRLHILFGSHFANDLPTLLVAAAPSSRGAASSLRRGCLCGGEISDERRTLRGIKFGARRHFLDRGVPFGD